MRIIDLVPDDEGLVQQTALLLWNGFKDLSPGTWPTEESAEVEVRESFGKDRISRVAIDEKRTVIGWIGAIGDFYRAAWEIHPLVVSPKHHRKGIGRALVADIENLAQQHGILTLWLGTDDETNQTTLSHVDLYPDVCRHIAAMRNLRGHPFEFYQKLGFVVVGVLPDVNGPGKPDILMAKRVQRL